MKVRVIVLLVEKIEKNMENSWQKVVKSEGNNVGKS